MGEWKKEKGIAHRSSSDGDKPIKQCMCLLCCCCCHRTRTQLNSTTLPYSVNPSVSRTLLFRPRLCQVPLNRHQPHLVASAAVSSPSSHTIPSPSAAANRTAPAFGSTRNAYLQSTHRDSDSFLDSVQVSPPRSTDTRTRIFASPSLHPYIYC